MEVKLACRCSLPLALLLSPQPVYEGLEHSLEQMDRVLVGIEAPTRGGVQGGAGGAEDIPMWCPGVTQWCDQR